MSRYDELTMKSIKDQYWPRLGKDGRVIKPRGCECKPKHSIESIATCLAGTYAGDVVGELDPDVVWVGPLIDGLISLGVFGGRTAKEARHNAKAFFYESSDVDVNPLKGPDAFNLTIERCETLGNETWPYAGTRYGREVLLRNISGKAGDSVEPGDIRNSPTPITEAGDIWAREQKFEEYSPKILVDERLGLHILHRGDRLVKNAVVRRQGRSVKIRETFILRPLSEGSSLLKDRVRTDRAIA